MMSEPVYIVNPDVVFRPEEDEAIVFHPESGEVKLLNRTSAFVFRLLDGKRDLAEIADNVVQEYDGADPDEVRQDVLEFIEIMKKLDFIFTVK